MNEQLCPKCGAALPSDAAEKLCTKCLLEAGLEAAAAGAHLHVRCPHCHNPIELVEETPLSDITCPSCDSKFSLVGDETMSIARDKTTTIGQFELIEQVGIGGFGTVWKARDTELDRTVAVKVPRRDQVSSTDIDQFMREARAAAQLKHPNIVGVHEVGRSHGQVYIVSDFVDGVTLADWLSGHQPTPREAAELCARLADALIHAHQSGVIHRDLKPSNVMLDERGEPHIMDFGLAKRDAGEITMTVDGKVLGTPAYMSPEQARGEGHGADARSDVYSLGVILFEMLTGEKPFRGTSRMLLHQVIHDDAPQPRRLNAAVPRDLETICLKCLEKNPDGRYPSARALCDEFQRYLRGEPIQARPIGPLRRCSKWARRHPAIAALSVACGVFAIAVVTILAAANLMLRFAQQNTAAAYDELKIEQRNTQSALEQQRRAAYGHHIALAHSEWMANNVPRAEALLDACAEPRRHWEWNYLKRLCRGTAHSWEEPGATHCVAFSPDGNLLAAGGGNIGFGPFVSDQELSLWDVSARRNLGDFRKEDHRGAITGVAFSPDNRRLALALWCLDDARDVITMRNVHEDDAGRIEVWDLKTKKLVHSLRSHQRFVNGLAFSPDGRRVASASSDGTAHVWDADSGESVFALAGHRGQVISVAFSPDGQLIATGGEGPLENFTSQTLNDFGEVILWDANTGIELRKLAGHRQGVSSVAFHPDSLLLASASRDRTVAIWDTRSGMETRRLFGHTHAVRGVAFSPGGTRLASVSDDRTLRIWNAADGEELQVLRGGTCALRDLAWHADDRTVATSEDGWRQEEPCVRIWDTGVPLESVVCTGHNDVVNQIRLSPDGSLVASRSGEQGSHPLEIRIFDTRNGQQLCHIPGDDAESGFFFSKDSQRLVTMKDYDTVDIAVFDVHSGRSLSAVSLGDPTSTSSVAGYPELAPDAQRVATVDFENNVVRIWDVDSGDQLRDFSISPVKGDYRDRSASLKFSPTGRHLAIAIDARTEHWRTNELRVWNLDTGELLSSHQPTNVSAGYLSFSQDERTLAMVNDAGDKCELLGWQLDPLQQFTPIKLGDTACEGLHVFPNGERVLTIHDDERLLMKVWDLSSGALQFTLDGFENRSRGLHYGGEAAFTPDGHRIITVGDGTIKIWDALDGNALLSMAPALSRLRISRDGRCIAAATPQGRLNLWWSE